MSNTRSYPLGPEEQTPPKTRSERNMRHRILRNRFAAAASLAVVTITMTMTLGAGVASANPPSPTYGVAPHWFVGKPEQVRDAGSDTTFFAIQRLSDLFVQSGLYGCQLNLALVPN